MQHVLCERLRYAGGIISFGEHVRQIEVPGACRPSDFIGTNGGFNWNIGKVEVTVACILSVGLIVPRDVTCAIFRFEREQLRAFLFISRQLSSLSLWMFSSLLLPCCIFRKIARRGPLLPPASLPARSWHFSRIPVHVSSLVLAVVVLGYSRHSR